MDNEDDWLALDKLYHILFCFFISLLFSIISSRTRYPLLRRYSIWIGSIVSLSAGAVKEAADEIGIFKSAGASPKDAVSDLIGVFIALIVLSLWKCTIRSKNEMNRVRDVSLV